MDGHFFFYLLNPAVGMLLMTAFLTLWHFQRERRYIAIAALGYGFSAVGFLIQDVLPNIEASPNRTISNLCFLLAASSLAVAILSRYDLPTPFTWLAGILTVGMGMFCWFLYIDPDLTVRIYAISFTLGTVALFVAVRLKAVQKPHFIDKLLFAVCILSAANFILRPIIIFSYVGHFDTYDDFQHSIYWTTVQVTQTLISVIIAFNLMVAVALDYMSDLKQESQIDRLSGLFNRRGFEEQAADMLRGCVRHARPVAMLLADLDHFKLVNDTYGHAAGDQVIASFGKLLRESASGEMIAGRIGGEEFAVLMPGSNTASARLFAEALRVSLNAAAIPGLPEEVRITASFGVCASTFGEDLSALLRQADAAMYGAKRKGRDRVNVSADRPAEIISNAIRPV